MGDSRFFYPALALLFSFLLVFSGQAKINVHELYLEGETSNDYCHAIIKDRSGFLWIATDNGLRRYDGYSLTYFDQHPDSSFPLGANITELLLDTDGTIWAGGLELIRYRPTKDQFITYPVTGGNNIWAMYRDPNNILWIGGEGFGLRGVDTSSGQVLYQFFNEPNERFINTIIPHQESHQVWVASSAGIYLFDTESHAIEQTPVPADNILDLLEAEDGKVWIATTSGLWVLDPETQQTRYYSADQDEAGTLKSNTIWSLFQDSKGQIWLGTDKQGVHRYLPETDSFVHLAATNAKDLSFPPGAVTDIFEDESGTLWFTVANFGVYRISEHLEKFKVLRHNEKSDNSLGFNNTLDLHQDESGAIWIATDGGGLDRYDPVSGNFEHFRHDENDPTTISSNSVLAIAEDANQDLWFGTWGGGISKLDRESMTFSQVTREQGANEGEGLSDINVFRILVDEHNKLLLSVWGKGLQIYDPSNQQFQTYFPGGVGLNSGISNFSINDIEPTGQGRYWIGGHNGLEFFDTTTNLFERIELPYI